VKHTKVQNTDQANFPVLINTIDPTLASTANGGHVANANGYDIVFTSDATCSKHLNFEIESWNATSGQLVAWVQLPVLSHVSDTNFFVCYGNPAIATAQSNPSGVWDSNYKGVWHLGNGSALSLVDSTSNANNAINNGALPTPGEIAGGMLTNGSTYATIGTPSSLANLAQGNATFSAWVYSVTGNGGRMMGKDDNNISSGWAIGLNGNNYVDFVEVCTGPDFRLYSNAAVPNGAWSYVVVTLTGSATGSSTATIYINAVPGGNGSGGSGGTADDSAQTAYLANATYGDLAGAPFNGSLDEFRISNTIRSPDWIATEYNNQSSPGTFYTLGAENADAVLVTPSAASLTGSQTQQFVSIVLGACNQNVTWSINPSGAGSISAGGLYTAPANIASDQTVTVTATSAADSSIAGTATISLVAPISIAVTPASATLSSQQTQPFAATIENTNNTAVAWTISPANAGSIAPNGLYTAPYNISTQQTVTVTATSQADPTKSASATTTLSPTLVSNDTLTLLPSSAGPDVAGSTQTLTCVVKDVSGNPISGASVQFAVSGVNATSGSANTDTTGTATFTYTGSQVGSDTVQASYAGYVSNTSSVTWVTPLQVISESTITGQFFLSDGSGGFDTPPGTPPVFTQVFPVINFNPPAGTVPNNSSGVNVGTRPFTDVTTDLNGNYTGTIVAQGNGYQAGVGPMYTFQAVFSGSFAIASPGNVVFQFYDDDGFIFGVGGGASRVSGSLFYPPLDGLTPFANLPVMGTYNAPTPPTGNTIVVNFPAPGTFRSRSITRSVAAANWR
jgi:hypothetical protein